MMSVKLAQFLHLLYIFRISFVQVTPNAPCSEIGEPESEADVDYNFEPVSIGNLTFHVRDLQSSVQSEDTSFLNSYKSHDVIPNVYEGEVSNDM
jgi:hypothetical protein